MSKSYCIYLVEFEGKRRYVGQTSNLRQRLSNHHLKGLALDHRARGAPFHFEVIAEGLDEFEADDLEIAAISAFGTLWPNGLNQTVGGRNRAWKVQRPKAVREVISDVDFSQHWSTRFDATTIKDPVDISADEAPSPGAEPLRRRKHYEPGPPIKSLHKLVMDGCSWGELVGTLLKSV